MSAFFYPSTNRCTSLRSIRKPPWSFWLNLCLKFTARLRDLTDNCMCGVQRRGSHSKIIFNTLFAQRVSPCNLLCDLLSTFLLLNVFRFAMATSLNTYWLKTFQLFIFNSFVKVAKKHNSTLTLWGICNVGCNTTTCVKSQGVWKLSEGTVD
jgi:hypothetical protein